MKIRMLLLTFATLLFVAPGAQGQNHTSDLRKQKDLRRELLLSLFQIANLTNQGDRERTQYAKMGNNALGICQYTRPKSDGLGENVKNPDFKCYEAVYKAIEEFTLSKRYFPIPNKPRIPDSMRAQAVEAGLIGGHPKGKPLPQTPVELERENQKNRDEHLNLSKDPRVLRSDPLTKGCTRIIDNNLQKVSRSCGRDLIKSQECKQVLKDALAYIRKYLDQGCPK